jgi:hypothetical protein
MDTECALLHNTDVVPTAGHNLSAIFLVVVRIFVGRDLAVPVEIVVFVGLLPVEVVHSIRA